MSAPQPIDPLARVAHLEAEVHHYRTLFLRERDLLERLRADIAERGTEGYLARIEAQLAHYKDLFRKASEDRKRLRDDVATLRRGRDRFRGGAT